MTGRFKSLLTTLLAASVLAWAAAQAQTAAEFDLPAQPLAESLRAVATATHINVLFDTAEIASRSAPALRGRITIDEALSRLLVGTGLIHQYLDDNTIVLAAEANKAGGKSTSQRVVPQVMRLAQATGERGGTAPVRDSAQAADVRQESGQKDTASGDASGKSSEITVTGSRLSRSGVEGPVPVNVYTREDIVRSGQGSVSDFLNTLSEVSVSTTENSPAGGLGQTAVRLRGLPLGSTLVLINGRRVDSGGSTIYYGGAFDLNNIPAGAIERVEVVPEGSSAVYGSEALAGVINIILKKDLNGLELNARYGAASGVDETTADAAWGKTWSRGHVAIMGTYFTRSMLGEYERSITSDQTIGVLNEQCSPGNVYSTDGSNLPGLGAPLAAIAPGVTGVPTVANFLPGQLNRCRAYDGRSPIPPADRSSAFATGSFQIGANTELFAEAMYTSQEQTLNLTRRSLARVVVPASNAFNPFGRDILVNYRINSQAATPDYSGDTDYVRLLAGARGKLSRSWDWEVAGWQSSTDVHNTQGGVITNTAARTAALASSNPATAINVFTSGSPASDAVMQGIYSDESTTQLGKVQIANALVRGTPLILPAGAVDLALGGEYTKTEVEWAYRVAPTSGFTYGRNAKSGYAEVRVPLLANLPALRMLALNAAVRYDEYNDFGGHTTPQYALEWRPEDSLLLRATYAESFKAPNLIYLFEAPSGADTCCVNDPVTGSNSVPYRFVRGGNAGLKPELGESQSVGAVWSPASIEGLEASLTWWKLKLSGFGTSLNPQLIVNYESFFPGRVIRNPTTNAITTVDVSWVNFGKLNLAGFDFNSSYRMSTSWGTFTPRVSVTQTYQYDAGLTPDAPITTRVGQADSTGWAPRWKGTVSLGWAKSAFSVNATGRYVSRYGDYRDLGPTSLRIGDFWLFDLNTRYELGTTLGRGIPSLRNAFVQLGAVNLFNSLPVYSSQNYGLQGYDTSQYDIRGRFIYANLGLSF